MANKPPKEVDVRCHRWFDKVNGNTYFSARMRDHETGDSLANIEYAYGYGDQYQYEILDAAIKEQGWKPRALFETSGCPPWVWYKDQDIRVNYFCTDGLKRDLKRV